jgi:hypothetical protein
MAEPESEPAPSTEEEVFGGEAEAIAEAEHGTSGARLAAGASDRPPVDAGELTRPAPDVAPASRPPAPIRDEELSPPPPSMLDRRAIGRLLRREVIERRGPEKSARRKGPFARGDAEREIEEAHSADQLIDVFFAFGSQYFEYSTLFRIHGDIAEGRDAWGPGAPREKVLGIGVPLDLPGAFATAKARAAFVLTRMNEGDLDRELVRDLGRERAVGTARAAAVIPLCLRARVVALLYGEDGDSDVTVTQLGDLVGFAALIAKHLERIAMAKKLGHSAAKVHVPRSARSSAPPPSTGAQRALLERWQNAIRNEAAGGSAPPPPAAPAPVEARVSSGAESLPPAAVMADLSEAEAGAIAYAPTQMAGFAAIPAPPATRPYDASAFGPTAAMGQVAVLPPVERIETVPGAGTPESVTHPRNELETGKARIPIPREEDDDASKWLVEQGGSPDPPVVRRDSPGRYTEYMIIPDRSGSRHDADPQRAREAALFGPYGALLMKATLGGLQAEEALSELAREAEHSLQKIVAAFPGPLLVDRFRMRDQLPPASQCGPLLKLLVMLRKSALGFMTVRGASSEPEQRFWATHVLGELLFPEASTAVLPRLFDDDVMVRRVARRSALELVNAGPPGEPLKHSLANMIASDDEPVHRRALAIETLGEIRAAGLLPSLIAALDDPSDTIVDAARRALLLIARQDFGPSVRDWTSWWEANREKRRVEWLIDALTHETPSLRRAAGDELKQITNEYFGYYDDLPPRDRERAQQKYREWWAEEGQFRHRV